MRITFDPKKRDITLKERGLDFKSAKEVFAGHHFTVQSIQNNYTEQRFMTVGKLDNRMVIVVWVPRGTAYRIISMSKANTRTEWIDPDDAPELTDDFFEEADEYYGNTLIRRGRASAQKRAVKKRISVHLSADVIGRFCAAGPDWEARMNTVLSNWLKRHSPEELSV